MGESPMLRALKAADFGFFGATWWPDADWERLKIATYLATWVCARQLALRTVLSYWWLLFSCSAGTMVRSPAR